MARYEHLPIYKQAMDVAIHNDSGGPTGRGHGPLLPGLGGSGVMRKEMLIGDFVFDTDTDSLFAPFAPSR